MGDFYKLQYALRDLNRTLSDDYQKLSDKFNELKLSHNRKKRALKKLFNLCDTDFISCDLVKRICSDALFCDGRLNTTIKKGKKNG